MAHHRLELPDPNWLHEQNVTSVSPSYPSEVPSSSKDADAGRMGKAVEYMVAASCILASRARLNVSTSFVDDEGVDLVFHRRNGTSTLSVQVKARMSDSERYMNGSFVAFVRGQTFQVRPDLHMLFVPVDVEGGTFEMAWLVPSDRFNTEARRSNGRLRFAASLKPNSRDKWHSFKVARPALPYRILKILESFDT